MRKSYNDLGKVASLLLCSLTMVVAGGRGVGRDDLYTAIRSVVRSLSLLTVVMTDVVCVLLVKLK